MLKVTHQIQLYASACTRNDFYLDRIHAAAEKLGLSFTLEKVTDEAAIEAQGLLVACLYAYCPGCRAMHATLTDETGRPEHCTPALAVDGRVIFDNYPPDDDALERLLSAYA